MSEKVLAMSDISEVLRMTVTTTMAIMIMKMMPEISVFLLVFPALPASKFNSSCRAFFFSSLVWVGFCDSFIWIPGAFYLISARLSLSSSSDFGLDFLAGAHSRGRAYE